MTPLTPSTRTLPALLGLCLALLTAGPAQAAKPLPLSAANIADIVTLEKIEDRRDFDAAALARIAASAHPELRRRAALSIARLYDPRGKALLAAMRQEAHAEVLSTVAWADGQLLDDGAVEWLDGLLQDPKTPVEVATEAAGAFGKIRNADTRQRLARYLGSAAPGARTAPVVAEALLSIGRHGPGDVSAIVKWLGSADPALRLNATWALFRTRDPAAPAHMVTLAQDASPEVRLWAMRGLNAARVDKTSVTKEAAEAILLAALRDADRRVQTEAVRALGSYTSAASLPPLMAQLDAADLWVAVSAADALGQRGDKASAAIEKLEATARTGPTPWLRAQALTALVKISPAAALRPATELSQGDPWVTRNAAANALAKLGPAAREAMEPLAKDGDPDIRGTAVQALLELADSADDLTLRRQARSAALASDDDVTRAAAASSMSKWATPDDIPALLDAFARGLKDTSPNASEAAAEVLADIESRGGKAADAFFARFPASPGTTMWGIAGRAFGPRVLTAWGDGRPIASARTEADYRRIVQTLVVPAYYGKPAPRLRWATTRGDVDTVLNALDAPLATDYLLQLTAQGAMKAIRFDRVVPNFVAQQRVVLLAQTLQRDEISRGRLVRGRLSWGSTIGFAPHFPGTRGPGAAYDTGPAVYTFAHTPQAHNEGDFTALGMIVRGMDAVDNMALGDFVTSVRVLKAAEK